MLTVMKKSTLIIIDKKRIEIYSPKKIIRKQTDLYSVLNPLTSSDSPSEKSKGDRLVSAKEETKNMIIRRKKNVTRLVNLI